MKVLFTLLVLFVLVGSAFANNPGGHQVQLSWTDTCAAGQTCSYNVYRGTSPGVCGPGKTPYANTSNLSFEDDSVTAGTTYVYAVTQWLSGGGESACSAEAQIAVSSAQGTTPGLPQGQAH
jgi:fibronectin type 3 domain-containing protein